MVKVYLLVCLLLLVVHGDIYLHHPRGSNGRNREQTTNRRNANRLMDTQNNAQGGYPYCGSASKVDDTDGSEYYVGSMLRVEWTNQHSCGPDSNALCTVILQYACEDTLPLLRDGYPSDPTLVTNKDPGYLKASFRDNRDDGTDTIPCPSSVSGCSGNRFNSDLDTDNVKYTGFYQGHVIDDSHYPLEYGYHESFNFYREQCLYTSRNKGLYTADQKVGHQARHTRQNPNGNRFGFECSEERDYYPWWQPTPWKDIAVLVSDDSWCPYYKNETFNVKSRYICEMSDQLRKNSANGLKPVFENECKAQGGTWTRVEPHKINAPECIHHGIARDNHLGNSIPVDSKGKPTSGSHTTSFYDWKIPNDAMDQKCVIRLRYNISSIDYNSMNSYSLKFRDTDGVFWDYRHNCDKTATGNIDDQHCSGILNHQITPLYNRPYVKFIDNTPKLGFAFNTNQIGRTFQDRSFVFKVLKRPDGVSDKDTVWNLGYRGKRGNIVQAYPAVEYDFVPKNLHVTNLDYVHIQYCGSDFNTARNPNNGEGWQYSDRTNMVQINSLQDNYPLPVTNMTMFKDLSDIQNFMFAGIDLDNVECHEFPNNVDGDNDNSVYNCGKLNPAPARFNGGLHRFKQGVYYYMSTRNNNFSNRSQKGTITVSSVSNTAQVVAIVVSTIVGVVGLLSGIVLFIRKRPQSGLANAFNKVIKPGKVNNNAVNNV